MKYPTRTRICKFKATGYKSGYMEFLEKTLNALGIPTRCILSKSGRSAEVAIEIPEYEFEAQMMRSRRAGRRRLVIDPPKESQFNSKTLCKDYLAWQDEHSAKEGMEELGLSNATFYRKLKKMKEDVKERDRINAARAKDPNQDLRQLKPLELGDI